MINAHLGDWNETSSAHQNYRNTFRFLFGFPQFLATTEVSPSKFASSAYALTLQRFTWELAHKRDVSQIHFSITRCPFLRFPQKHQMISGLQLTERLRSGHTFPTPGYPHRPHRRQKSIHLNRETFIKILNVSSLSSSKFNSLRQAEGEGKGGHERHLSFLYCSLACRSQSL